MQKEFTLSATFNPFDLLLLAKYFNPFDLLVLAKYFNPFEIKNKIKKPQIDRFISIQQRKDKYFRDREP